MTTVEYKRANIHGIGANVNGKIVHIRLTPGMNTLDSAVWESAKKHPLVKAMIEAGVIIEKKKTDSFMNITSAEAIEIVEKTTDVTKLKDMMSQTRTKKVKAAIEAQIEKIEAGE